MDKHTKKKVVEPKPNGGESDNLKDAGADNSSFYNKPDEHEYILLDEVQTNDVKGFEHIDLVDDESDTNAQRRTDDKAIDPGSDTAESDKIEYPDIE